MGIIERIKHMITAQRLHHKTSETAVATKGLHVTDYLTEKNILFFPARLDKSHIFKELIGSMDLSDPELALKEVLYRELWGRTLVAPGLAIPHARIPTMTRIGASIGICQAGAGDPTGSKPCLYLLFIGPTHDVQQHLLFLAGVSTLFQTKGLVERLSRLTSPGAVLSQLRTAEAAL
jgi:mannitol/fructose-specific phosphotransferase system IIA component (Ntr-type)